MRKWIVLLLFVGLIVFGLGTTLVPMMSTPKGSAAVSPAAADAPLAQTAAIR